MRKQVQNIIAAARILIRRPGEQELPSEDMRYLLHSVLDELNTRALKNNRDYFTKQELVTFVQESGSSNSARDWWTPTLDHSTALKDFYPVALFYRPENSSTDAVWARLRRVKLEQLHHHTGLSVPSFAVVETNSTTKPVRFAINLTAAQVQSYDWKLQYREYPNATMEFDAEVPFPQEHTQLLEVSLAAAALPLVNNNSQDWRMFAAQRTAELGVKRLELLNQFDEWMDRDIENIIMDVKPFSPRSSGTRRTYIVESQ